MSTDPLSLLAGEASSSSDESEGEEEDDESKRPLNHSSYYTPSASSQQSAGDKLPSPNTLFEAVGQPEFLTTHLQPNRVNWDRLIKNVESAAEENIHTSGNYAAIPPPEERDNDPRSEISAAPVKYAVPDASKLDPKMMSVSSDASDEVQPSKAPKRGKPSSPPSAKKSKGDTFRDKEKRKRDLGMSSRAKSFVEEEKRILRQQFDKDT